MDKVKTDFNNFSFWRKEKACALINTPAGWDIPALWDKNYDGVPDQGLLRAGGYDHWVPQHAKSWCCPSKYCYGSVEVDGKCFKASSVNYILYGFARRLCYDYFSSWDDPIYGVSENECLRGALRLAGGWKKVIYGESDSKTREAMEWLQAGWYLAIPGGGYTLEGFASAIKPGHYGHCETGCMAAPSDFSYVWLGGN